jgi:hypothetical protein
VGLKNAKLRFVIIKNEISSVMSIYQWNICKDFRFIFDEPHFYLILITKQPQYPKTPHIRTSLPHYSFLNEVTRLMWEEHYCYRGFLVNRSEKIR